MARANFKNSSGGTAALIARLSLGVTFLIIVGLATGAWLAYPRLQARVAQIKREAVTVRISWPPIGLGGTKPASDAKTWLSEPFQFQLTSLAQGVLSEDPFDRASLERCARALYDTGWFKETPRVFRERDGIVRVEGSWRTPAAVVRRGEVDYLVSPDGELLPVEYKLGASGLRYIAAPFADPPALGERWVGGDVQAALALLAQLQATKAYNQVSGIDVSRFVQQRRLVIITDRQNRLVWGAPPGEFKPGEPSTDVKLKWLAYLAGSPDFERRIDANKPMLDLTIPGGPMIDVSAQPGAGKGGEPAGTGGAGGSEEVKPHREVLVDRGSGAKPGKRP